MAISADLRAWAGAIRWWADTVEDLATAAHMRALADELDAVAKAKDQHPKVDQPFS